MVFRTEFGGSFVFDRYPGDTESSCADFMQSFRSMKKISDTQSGENPDAEAYEIPHEVNLLTVQKSEKNV